MILFNKNRTNFIISLMKVFQTFCSSNMKENFIGNIFENLIFMKKFEIKKNSTTWQHDYSTSNTKELSHCQYNAWFFSNKICFTRNYLWTTFAAAIYWVLKVIISLQFILALKFICFYILWPWYKFMIYKRCRPL